jgi:hypothetical protein
MSSPKQPPTKTPQELFDLAAGDGFEIKVGSSESSWITLEKVMLIPSIFDPRADHTTHNAAVENVQNRAKELLAGLPRAAHEVRRRTPLLDRVGQPGNIGPKRARVGCQISGIDRRFREELTRLYAPIRDHLDHLHQLDMSFDAVVKEEVALDPTVQRLEAEAVEIKQRAKLIEEQLQAERQRAWDEREPRRRSFRVVASDREL